MFMSAARKAAEVVGIMEEVPEHIEEEVAAIPTEQPDIIVSLAQVGNVRYTYFNPAGDLKILEELFGVLHEQKQLHNLSCPSCSHEDTCPTGTFDDDEEVQCSECHYEADFDCFDDGIYKTWTCSRKYTSAEVVHVGSDRYSARVMLDYYAALMGKPDELEGRENYTFNGEYVNGLPLYEDNTYDWHKRTPDWGDLRGKLRSISEMDTQADKESF